MKRRAFIIGITLMLCLLLVETVLFSILLVRERNRTKTAVAEADSYRKQWESATDHQPYSADGLQQDANILMENLSFQEGRFTFTVVNNTRHTLHFGESDICIQRFENNEWSAVGFGWVSGEVLISLGPGQKEPMSVSCHTYDDQGTLIPCDPIPSGLYRVRMDISDYSIVGYIIL